MRQQQYGGDAAGGLGEVVDFVGVKGAAEDGSLAVGEPLLQDLVAAELVFPDGGGDVAPVGAVVEVDVISGWAEDGLGGWGIGVGWGGGVIGLRGGTGLGEHPHPAPLPSRERGWDAEMRLEETPST